MFITISTENHTVPPVSNTVEQELFSRLHLLHCPRLSDPVDKQHFYDKMSVKGVTVLLLCLNYLVSFSGDVSNFPVLLFWLKIAHLDLLCKIATVTNVTKGTLNKKYSQFFVFFK